MLRTLCDGHGGNGPSDADDILAPPVLFEPDKDQIPQIMERIFLQYYKLYEGADKILDYYRASKGAFLCIQKNKRILHYGYIIKQSL